MVDDTVFGKPTGRTDAITMLQVLSGRSHVVMTGVAVVSASDVCVSLSTTRVDFRTLSQVEIEAYWDTGEPCDKAGSYAIQGLAAMFVKRIEGSYSGVVGLPLFETSECLRQFGFEVLHQL